MGQLMLHNFNFFLELFFNVIGHPLSVAGSRQSPAASVKELEN
jgi:hypothetical protein